MGYGPRWPLRRVVPRPRARPAGDHPGRGCERERQSRQQRDRPAHSRLGRRRLERRGGIPQLLGRRQSQVLRLLIATLMKIMYNTMMPTQTFLTALALASMALPMAASAYEAPEDTLFQENFDEGFLLPPTQRDIKERVMEQQRRSAERREREYSAARSSSSAAPVEEESVDEPTGEDIPSDLQQTIDALNDKLDAFEEEEQSLEARRKE